LLFQSLVVIAVVHALAALYHHLWMKDDTLRRMLPFSRPRAG
jgi:cytochrome b561